MDNQENAVVKAESTDIANEFAKPVSVIAGGNLAVESSREASEVLGMIMSAKRFPRDKFTAMQNILQSCERYSLAEKAEYAYPRGGQTVKGPSIRLAEVLAQSWGNLDYGVIELEQRNGESIMQAFCWDLETNVRSKRNFTVRHERHTKQGVKALDDPRDIYELTANQGSRRVRACILAVIPGDVSEKAVNKCRETLLKGVKGETLQDKILKMLQLFSKLGVPQEAIEKRLGHKIDLVTPDEWADLTTIYNSIRDNMTKRQDWFDIGGDAQSELTKELNAKFAGKKAAARQPGEDD